MASVFTRIIDGELPGHFVWKDADTVAFLSINPLKPGHTLVVPRKEVDHWLDADAGLRGTLMETAHAVGRALERAYEPTKVGLMIAGLEVPHLHVHVVPIWNVHDLDFARAAKSVEPDALREAADRIRGALRALGYENVTES